MEREWIAQFRKASPALQRFYDAMPDLQEAWSRTTQPNVYRYFAFSRVSDDRLINIAQNFEVTTSGLQPIGNPVYYREDILNEHRGFYSATLKTTSTSLTPAELGELYANYNVSIPDTVESAGGNE
jgi:hypothetical protein